MSASKARARQAGIVKALIWFHRWLGIATCLVFALWFASGAILLFEPFPSLGRDAQFALEAPVATASIRITPSTAIAAAGGIASAVRLVSRGDRPAYVIETEHGTRAIDAVSGARLAPLSPDAAATVTSRLASGATTTPTSFDYDQWIVHNRFDPLRPFYRIDLADEAGTRLYLSAVSGEIVQRTTRWQRGWNWPGAVLHWVYFTPLRSSFTAWDQTVWWVSLVALLVAVAGTILGVIRTVAARRQRKPSLSFFRLKWLRWHHILGLFVSIFVLGWILSGWLSMDHGRLFSRGALSSTQAAAYAGGTLDRGLSAVALPTIGSIAGAREINFSLVAGQPIVTAWLADACAVRLDAVGRPLTTAKLDQLGMQGTLRAWPASEPAQPVQAGQSNVYALAEGWPATARLIPGDSGRRPEIIFDGATGRVLTVNNASRKAYGWIYYALHTFNVPGLIERPTLRRILVLVPLVAGFLFSITGVVIGWQRLRRTLKLPHR